VVRAYERAAGGHPSQSRTSQNQYAPKFAKIGGVVETSYGFYAATMYTGFPRYDTTGPIEESDLGIEIDPIDIIVVNALEAHGAPPFIEGDIVPVMLSGSITGMLNAPGQTTDGGADDGLPIAIALQARPSSMDVTLAQDGGVDGDESGAPTYTYTATDQNGNVVAEELSPDHNRPIGKTMVATRGRVAYIDNAWALVDSDERPNFAECS